MSTVIAAAGVSYVCLLLYPDLFLGSPHPKMFMRTVASHFGEGHYIHLHLMEWTRTVVVLLTAYYLQGQSLGLYFFFVAALPLKITGWVLSVELK